LGGWETDDLDGEMAERGFVRSCWFKDSEGNRLGIIHLAQH